MEKSARTDHPTIRMPPKMRNIRVLSSTSPEIMLRLCSHFRRLESCSGHDVYRDNITFFTSGFENNDLVQKASSSLSHSALPWPILDKNPRLPFAQMEGFQHVNDAPNFEQRPSLIFESRLQHD
ncbi:hypothetical protein chiPu_0021498 [Chiloscyllium punctatum]|uniref:Uncharacterized protein n=1 Tax=Chiloscyllium punctatum TaxID=137246 RepID=A0A401RG70_CHIPU|nr:hypothetical protein [Chiloscyllium punctatum]